MSRRSPRKKAISPITVDDSDDQGFLAAASDDQYLVFSIIMANFSYFYFYSTGKEVDNHPHTDQEDDEVLVAPTSLSSTFFSYLYFPSIEITPPPTPSPVKVAVGKKRSMAAYESDDDKDVFVPRYDIFIVYYIYNIDPKTYVH
jgi:hypothetical protein